MQALTNLIKRTLALTESGLITAEFDPDWRSPCEIEQSGTKTLWRPVEQVPPVSFEGLGHALEIEIHPDICSYYSSYWSGTLEANSDEGRVSLIQLWNEDDFERLIANLIGHSLAKYRTRSPFSVFFATTDPDSELFLSICNDTGQVLLEEPGKPPLQTVETDISTFLDRLEPQAREPDIY
jgi:SecY interacting protein Syd